MPKNWVKKHISIKKRMAVKSLMSAFVPYRCRYKHSVWDKFSFLENSQFWPIEKQRQFQLEKLKETLLLALHCNRYYQSIFKDVGLSQHQINSAKNPHELLDDLPFLTKQKVRNNLEELKNTNISSGELVAKTTSGSTGRPLNFYNSKECLEWEQAFMWRHWKNASRWQPGRKMAFIRTYIPNPKHNDPLYYYDPWSRIHWFSAYHMTDENLGFYADIINKIKPDILVGYPSSIFILSEFLLRKNIHLEISGVVTSSESLPDYQREVIKKALGVNVCENYGLTERVVACGKCPTGEGYHDWFEYGFTEIVDESGNVVTDCGCVGEIVGTNFTNNQALPWIRYKTGDLGLYMKPVECRCGSKLPLIFKKIIGRTDDILYTIDGRKIPGVNFYTLFQKYVKEVKNFQLYQGQLDKIQVRLSVTDRYNNATQNSIASDIKSRLGQQMLFEFVIYDEIPREKNGKYKCIKRDKALDEISKNQQLQVV